MNTAMSNRTLSMFVIPFCIALSSVLPCNIVLFLKSKQEKPEMSVIAEQHLEMKYAGILQ